MSHALKTLDNKFKLHLNANNLNKYTEKQQKKNVDKYFGCHFLPKQIIYEGCFVFQVNFV